MLQLLRPYHKNNNNHNKINDCQQTQFIHRGNKLFKYKDKKREVGNH